MSDRFFSWALNVESLYVFGVVQDPLVSSNTNPHNTPPTTLFLQSVMDVIVEAPETTTARRVWSEFHALVDVWMAPAVSIMIYVVTLAPTVRVPPAYCHSVPHTR
jgi:hypothetical protein